MLELQLPRPPPPPPPSTWELCWDEAPLYLSMWQRAVPGLATHEGQGKKACGALPNPTLPRMGVAGP